MGTYGPAYNEAKDGERIRKQHLVIKTLMFDKKWRTLNQIHELTGYPPASISAQLRHLRKPKFGAHTVEKRRINDSGLWEYRVLKSA